MNATPTPPKMTSLDEAQGVVADQFHTIQHLLWRVAQLEKQLYGASSERQAGSTLSKEQILFSLFPPAVVAASAEVVEPVSVPTAEKPSVRSVVKRASASN